MSIEKTMSLGEDERRPDWNDTNFPNPMIKLTTFTHVGSTSTAAGQFCSKPIGYGEPQDILYRESRLLPI